MSNGVNPTTPAGHVGNIYRGVGQGVRVVSGGGAAATSGGAASALQRGNDVITLSRAAMDELGTDIRNYAKKIAGKEEGIGYEEIEKWLKNKGASLKNLKNLSGQKLLHIRNLLSQALNGVKNEVSGVMQKINARIQLANTARKELMELTKYIDDKLAKPLGVSRQDVWKIIKGNISGVQKITQQIGGGNTSVNIIEKAIGNVKSISTRTLSKMNLGQIQQLKAAVIDTVKPQAVTIQRAGQVISGTALSIAGRNVFIAGASNLGRLLLTALGRTSSVGAAATVGWVTGRLVGEHLYINGKNVDTILQESFGKNWGLLRISSNAEWGSTALDHINKQK